MVQDTYLCVLVCCQAKLFFMTSQYGHTPEIFIEQIDILNHRPHRDGTEEDNSEYGLSLVAS